MYDLIVIGSGPAGYVGAIKAAQLGKKVACVELDKLGGVCLNWGCIPTKALLKNAEVYDLIKNKSKNFGISVSDVSFDFGEVIDRSRNIADRLSKGVQFLLKKNKIDVITGEAKIISENEIEVSSLKTTKKYKASKFLIATGASPIEIPTIPFDHKKIISSKSALIDKDLPEKIVIMGAGAIGVEFAYIYNSFGVDVTIVEMQNCILPLEDKESSSVLTKEFKKKGIKILTNHRVNVVKNQKDGVSVEVISVSNEEKKIIDADKLLVAVGVKPNAISAEKELQIETTDKGAFIKVDKRYKTNLENFYAVGDIIGAPLLAHVASWEAIEAVKGIFTESTPLQVSNFPSCTYCKPQVASIGETEESLKEKNIEYSVGKYPYMANGKAIATDATEGFVKLLFGKEDQELLGAHIVGDNATDLIGEIVVGLKLEITSDELEHIMHPHPTLSEMIMEASADSLDQAIHL